MGSVALTHHQSNNKRKEHPTTLIQANAVATAKRQLFAQYIEQEYRLSEQTSGQCNRYQLDRLFPKYRQTFNAMDLTRELSSIVSQSVSPANWYASFVLPIRIALRVKDTAVDWDTVFFRCICNINDSDHSSAINVSQLYQLLEQSNRLPKLYTLNRSLTQCNHHQVMQFLFSKGAEIPTRYLANNLFRRASSRNNVKMMRLLLKNAPITDFYTPLKEYLVKHTSGNNNFYADTLYCLLESGSASYFFNASLAFSDDPRICEMVQTCLSNPSQWIISEYSSHYIQNRKTITTYCQAILPKDVVQHIFVHYL